MAISTWAYKGEVLRKPSSKKIFLKRIFLRKIITEKQVTNIQSKYTEKVACLGGPRYKPYISGNVLDMSTTFPEHFQEISWTFSGNFRHMSGKVPEMFQDISWTFHENSWRKTT